MYTPGLSDEELDSVNHDSQLHQRTKRMSRCDDRTECSEVGHSEEVAGGEETSLNVE